jgi:anthranilate phosphoribosyltransferase
MVALNAAAALYVAGTADSIADALPRAFEALTDGRALETLYGVVEHSGGDVDRLDEARDRLLE